METVITVNDYEMVWNITDTVSLAWDCDDLVHSEGKPFESHQYTICYEGVRIGMVFTQPVGYFRKSHIAIDGELPMVYARMVHRALNNCDRFISRYQDTEII